ncbi:unnamed protein product [Triticum turgidum subsp. durum]|uniref:Uncharacterized protein n=1 Tax=Triticum turgidum subsp. durum TaxID=4567 RepID=A0A9R0RWB4_TRITD|nr:unnamed protein product [Triticum turgidum subsp. durum]
MAPADAARRLLLLLAVAGAVLRPAAAEIKQESFKDDSRGTILFEKFGFSHRGSVSIALTGAKVVSKLAKPEPAQLGFFLLSDEALFEAIYEQPPPTDLNPNPDPNTGCVLNSRYVIPLFTFGDLDATGNYSKTFPVSHPDEYSLFFANCAPETAVTMEVRTDMYNTNPDGTKDYLSVGQAPVPTIYAFFALGYVAFLAAWLYLTLYHNRLSAHRIHHLMSSCCCAVLFPVVWSMRSLRESSKTDGKAARTLAKLTLFRQFYVVVIGYLYFTRIIVYALKTITNYKYRWVSVAAEEVATMAFYMFMFYMFKPAERNQYFALDDDEEEAAEMALREEEFEL